MPAAVPYVPYGLRPEWDDVTPVAQPDTANPGEDQHNQIQVPNSEAGSATHLPQDIIFVLQLCYAECPPWVGAKQTHTGVSRPSLCSNQSEEHCFECPLQLKDAWCRPRSTMGEPAFSVACCQRAPCQRACQ
jgi:hypothetical protein